MIYVTSDLHGYSLDKVMSLLQNAGFNYNDFLFVLGDVIDRGEDGVKMLQWMMTQPNVELLMGNHEAMFLSCEFIFDEITDGFLTGLTSHKMSLLSTWQFNGAAPTIKALSCLTSPERNNILEYIREAPLFDTVTLNGRDFLLTHSGLGHFDPNKKMSEYTPDDLLWCRPRLETEYFDDITVVFGHTPTFKFGEAFKGRILKTRTWIDIDAGAANGYAPALLCLNTMEEFYMHTDE